MISVSGGATKLKHTCWLIVAGLLCACSPAPEFTDGSAQPISLRQFAGKPLLINYFAPWCSPCLREIPHLNALAAEGQIAVLIINYDPVTPTALRSQAAQYHIQVPLLVANADANLPFPQPSALPTSYLLDSKGQLKQTLVGELDQPQIAALNASVRTVD